MKRGEVYLCRLGPRDETGEERVIPVVVLSRDAINKFGPVVVVAPVVESGPAPHPYPSDVVVRAPEGGLTDDGLVLTMQLRAVPRERLHHLLGTLSANAMGEIDRAVRITLDLEES